MNNYKKDIFVNGLNSFLETYYQVVSYIETYQLNPFISNFKRISYIIEDTYEMQGISGLYDLAKTLTIKFEKKNINRVWYDGTFFDEINKFLEQELYK